MTKINEQKIPFKLLPQKIKNSHLKSSIELLEKIKRDRIIPEDQKNNSIKEVVERMNSCVQESDVYNLNVDAFSIHSANFRYDTIHEIFSKIGIDKISEKALADNTFLCYPIQK